ncbi:MAG: hypothetical protein WBR28_29125 [Mycobacterium sp.]
MTRDRPRRVEVRRFPSNRRVVTAAMRAGKSDLLSGILPRGCAFSYEAAQLITAATPTDDSRTLADLGIAWSQPRQAIIESPLHHECPVCH